MRLLLRNISKQPIRLQIYASISNCINVKYPSHTLSKTKNLKVRNDGNDHQRNQNQWSEITWNIKIDFIASDL